METSAVPSLPELRDAARRAHAEKAQPLYFGLWSDKQAAAYLSISKSLWWRWHKEGKTPRALKVGSATRWVCEEVVAFRNSLIAARDAA